MTAPLNRRGFLGAGALLAAGGLVLPRSALAAPSAPPPPPESTAALLARLRAVLDQPNRIWFGDVDGDRSGREDRYDCACARCQALRRQRWECLECGYDGPWLVSGCECRAIRASNIRFAREHITALELGHRDPRGWLVTLDEWRQQLRTFEAVPDVMCIAAPDFATQERRRRQGHRQCGHGTSYCPTCGNSGRGCDMDTPDCLLATIRELRAEMRRLEAAGRYA